MLCVMGQGTLSLAGCGTASHGFNLVHMKQRPTVFITNFKIMSSVGNYFPEILVNN